MTPPNPSNLLSYSTQLANSLKNSNNRIQVYTICKGDWGTKLQENPQLILQFVIMIQLTSRRILRD